LNQALPLLYRQIMPTIRAKPKDHEDHAGPPTGRWVHGATVYEIMGELPQPEEEDRFDPKTGQPVPKAAPVIGVLGVIEVFDPALLDELGLKVE
jgi:hypothetical protein